MSIGMSVVWGYFSVNFTSMLSMHWMTIVVNLVCITVDWGLRVNIGIVLVYCV